VEWDLIIMDEVKLKEKLRLIEALFAGPRQRVRRMPLTGRDSEF